MLIIIQARMSSKRLRGKVLKMINNKALLQRVFESVNKCKNVSKIVVATSTNREDKKIVNFCKKKKINYFMGDLNNVMKRFLEVLKRYDSKYFVRICADSPFIDTQLLSNSIKIAKSKNFDIVTNLLPRSFPKGQSIEIFKTSTFKKYYSKIKSKNDLEHVAPFFYRNKDKFRIKNILYKKNLSNLNLSVDTYADIKFARKVSRIIDNKFKSKYTLDNLLKILEKR
tara:strand:- start:1332 stop:2009 length:678 start_codon:yes stop_codon:yes gene_type:complete